MALPPWNGAARLPTRGVDEGNLQRSRVEQATATRAMAEGAADAVGDERVGIGVVILGKRTVRAMRASTVAPQAGCAESGPKGRVEERVHAVRGSVRSS
jgi:hypothetical protein